MYRMVFVTTKDKHEARAIATGLLEKKLIACANIVKGVESLFFWEGKIDEADEVMLILKTKASLMEEIIKTVKSLHSYQVPEIIAVPIQEGNQPYLDWVNESTTR